MNVPNPPLFTNDPVVDIELLKTYISDLYSSLIANTPVGYSAIDAMESKTLTVGDSLEDTQDFLGTLVQDLIIKGVIKS